MVFVGANGQGKSLLFEALHRFFIDFNPLGSAASAGVTDALWYRRETTQPIFFEVELRLGEDEARKLLPFGEKVFQLVKQSQKCDPINITIKRSLAPPATWNTEEIAWLGIPLVVNNSIVAPEKLLMSIFPEDYFKKYKMYFFNQGNSKDNIGGDRIVVDAEAKHAFRSNPSLDDLVRRAVIESSTETIGKNWQEWCNEQSLKVLQGPSDALEILPVTPETLQQVIIGLTNLRAGFKLIPASRDVKAMLGQRSSMLDPGLLQTITSTSIDRQRTSEKKWEQYRKLVESLLAKRLEPNPIQVLLKEGDLGLLPAQTGGGEQATMGLIWETMDAEGIVAVEEPENHLHPGLQRLLLRYFQQLASRSQVLISTHSAIFASKPDITGIYYISKDEQGVTKSERVSELNINRLIDELGIRASDIFDYDILVFVEGEDDVKILKALAKKLLTNSDISVGFVDSEGWNSMAYYANARILKSRKVKAIVFTVFDGDTEGDDKYKKIKERLIADLKISQDHIVTLKKSSIEAYLLVPSAIKRALPQIRLSEEEIKAFISTNESKKNKKDVLDTLLKRGGIGSYSGQLGAEITDNMLEDEIDTEFRNIMKKFSQSMESPKEKT